MTTLICSGSLYSDWQKLVTEDPAMHPERIKISNLGQKICNYHFHGSDPLEWKAFSPEEQFKERTSELFRIVETETLFTWSDTSSCLYLDFLKATVPNARFLLFYSSPEYDVSRYIEQHPFEKSHIEKVIKAWIERTRAMLDFFMNNWDRCLLVSTLGATTKSEELSQIIKKKYSLNPEQFSINPASFDSNTTLIKYLATDLLSGDHSVSQLYDEVRSAASLISDEESLMSDTDDRKKSLVCSAIAEIAASEKLKDSHLKLEKEVSLQRLQADHLMEELEVCFTDSTEQKKISDTITGYLAYDPLLKIIRYARQAK